MPARYLTIEDRHRQFTPILASLADFTLSEGEAVDAGIILTDPNISLYCLDDASQRAIFAELPPGVDLSRVPFVYQAQCDQALRLIAVPYDTFHALAQTLPEPQRLILIFSCGRSGTTLLSHVVNRLDHAQSLSEPDAASQFVHMLDADGTPDARVSALINDTVRLLFKPIALHRPEIGAIKFRAETTPTMSVYHAAYAQASSLYLYRDAIGYVASFARIFKDTPIPDLTPIEEMLGLVTAVLHVSAEKLLSYLDTGVTQVSLTQQFALMWLIHMERYLEQHARGTPVLAVRYADLNRQPEQTLRGIFDYCGLPSDQVAQTLGAFEGDSQAGTALAREKPNEATHIS